MTCPEPNDLLHAYLDGELDLAHTLDVERHLQGCPACSRVCSDLRELRTALQTGLPRFAAPAELRGRVRAALRQEAPRPGAWRWRMAALAASVVLLIAAVAGLGVAWPGASARERLVREVIASHIRSQQVANHLLDVESSDRHTVKPWFQGKLDFAPAVRDLSDDGFVLAGGRLDYVNGRSVAALVYRRRQHVINLLIWPGGPEEKESRPRSESRQGYQLVSWQRRGMHCWAVSDLNAGELAEFARLLRGRE